MRWSGFVLAVALLVSLHFALRPVWVSWTVAPDFLLCAALLAARRVRAGTAAGIGFALGLLEDALAVTRFGLAALVFTGISYLGARTRDVFLGDEPLFLAGYLFVGKWAADLALQIGAGTGSWLGLGVWAPLSALATAVVGVLVSAAVPAPR